MDGTIKSSPKHFYQLYSIHARVHDNFPLVLCFMTGKTEALCIYLLKEIVQCVQDLSYRPTPLDVTMDFEKAAHNAALEVFDLPTRLHGRFFHLRQSKWRQVQANGVASNYNNDVKFAEYIHMIDALAFLPAPSVAAAFQEIKQELTDARLTVRVV